MIVQHGFCRVHRLFFWPALVGGKTRISTVFKIGVPFACCAAVVYPWRNTYPWHMDWMWPFLRHTFFVAEGLARASDPYVSDTLGVDQRLDPAQEACCGGPRRRTDLWYGGLVMYEHKAA